MRLFRKCVVRFAQAKHLAEAVDSIMLEAALQETSPGKTLFLRLPEPAANIALRHHFDPYRLYLNKDGLRHWLENHILFDEDGRMVVLHNDGVILWRANDVRLKDLLKEFK